MKNNNTWQLISCYKNNKTKVIRLIHVSLMCHAKKACKSCIKNAIFKCALVCFIMSMMFIGIFKPAHAQIIDINLQDNQNGENTFNQEEITKVRITQKLATKSYLAQAKQSDDESLDSQQETKEGDELSNSNQSESNQEEGSETAYMEDVTKFHIGDDPTVIVLIAMFILAIGVTIDRILVLQKDKGNNVELADMLIGYLKDMPGNVEPLIEKINQGRYGMEGRVILKTLTGWKHGDKSMAEFAEAALIAERRKLEKRIVVLSTLGNNTPFIGLLGTVLGIMKAFRDLALMGDAGPAVVMKGISEALIATAFGLGVAIPCVIANNSLSKIIKTKVSNAEEMIRMVSGFRLAKDAGKSS